MLEFPIPKFFFKEFTNTDKVMLYSIMTGSYGYVNHLVRYARLTTWIALIESMTAGDSWVYGHHILLPPKHGPQLPSIPHGHNSTTPKPSSRNNALFMCWKWSRMGLQSESVLDKSRGILVCAESLGCFDLFIPGSTVRIPTTMEYKR